MTYSFDWPVNHVSFSPDKAMLCVVGDNKDAALLDSRSGHRIANLRGDSNSTHQGLGGLRWLPPRFAFFFL